MVGNKTTSAKRDPITDAKPAMLNVGLIRKKKRPAEDMNGGALEAEPESKETGINTLSEGLLRKKMKIANHVGPISTEEIQRNGKAEPG